MTYSQKTVKLAKITLILSMLLLFWIIALKCNMPAPISDTRAMNEGTTLAERFERYLSYKTFSSSLTDTVANILLTLPIGMLLPFVFTKRPYLLSCLLSFLIAVGFEVFQIISCIGMFTYIDIINNTLGGLLGVLTHFFLRKIVREKPLNAIFSFLIVGISLALVFATVNTIVHIELYI